MKDTQEILVKMGFTNQHKNIWNADWFGVFILHIDATPKELAKFIYERGKNRIKGTVASYCKDAGIPAIDGKDFEDGEDYVILKHIP